MEIMQKVIYRDCSLSFIWNSLISYIKVHYEVLATKLPKKKLRISKGIPSGFSELLKQSQKVFLKKSGKNFWNSPWITFWRNLGRTPGKLPDGTDLVVSEETSGNPNGVSEGILTVAIKNPEESWK